MLYVLLAFGSEADDEKVSTTAEQVVVEDEPVAVEVPAIDSDELSSFFITSASASQHPDQQEREEASIDTFNDIFIDSNDMFVAFSLCCLVSYEIGYFKELLFYTTLFA